jgi:hypothetical protein
MICEQKYCRCGDLLELELALSGEVDLVVFEVSKLDSHEQTVFALGPLYFGEQSIQVWYG